MSGQFIKCDFVAYQMQVWMNDEIPSWYRRTYLFGVAFGPLVAAIAGLFDRNCSVWLWSEDKGFRLVVLEKRTPIPAPPVQS